MTNVVVARITVVGDDDTDADQAVQRLRQELRAIDDGVSLVPPPARPSTPGSRAGELVEIGTLLATVLAQPEYLMNVLMGVGNWLRRRGRGRVEVQIGEDRLVVELADPADQRKIIDAFVDKVLAPGP